ncbi:hypothetical protein [Alkalihalobacillus hemicellulosilyticus]|nr:hypothetical protein [Halalkalibacter hemicellulosilyticus]
MEFLVLLGIFIVLFITSNTIEKKVKSIHEQNEQIIQLLKEIKNK